MCKNSAEDSCDNLYPFLIGILFRVNINNE
jgi:hypothetical protein